ncbi:MAG: universal stress protein [Nitrospirae bacterium]|nr:universal stress protein [Nitrospirota bacterium]
MKIMKKFEDIFAAAAFAEEGEFETAREMVKGRQTVLLALTGRESDRKSFTYAMNICKRIGAGLEIVYVLNGSEMVSLMDQFQDELKKENIPYEIFQVNGSIKEEIINHTEKRSDIRFVVIESSDNLNIDCKKDNTTPPKAWEGLKCPLVVVMEGGK